MKSYLFIVFFSFTLFLYGQQQNFIVNENNIWSTLEIHCMPGGNNYSTYHLMIDGDTVLENIDYMKLMISESPDQNIWDLYGFIRETNGKVFLRPPGYIEGLIYSFDVAVGDTVIANNYYLNSDSLHFIVTDVDSVLMNDGYRKRISLFEYNNTKTEVWVEGFGSYFGLTNSCNDSYGGVCGSYQALCYEENGSLIFQHPDYASCHIELFVNVGDILSSDIQVFPNPAKEKIYIDLGSNFTTKNRFTVELLTIFGEKIAKKTLDNKENIVYLHPIDAGFYFLKVSNELKILSIEKILVD